MNLFIIQSSSENVMWKPVCVCVCVHVQSENSSLKDIYTCWRN